MAVKLQQRVPMGRVQGGEKFGLWKKKSKMGHNFFVTKATDLNFFF